MRKYLSLLILVPLAIVLIAFSVANRHVVSLSFDPTNAADPVFALQLPMFVFIFAALATGLVLGGIGTWFTQGKHRKLARMKNKEAEKWRFEAEHQQDAQKTEEVFTKSGSGNSFPVVPSSKAA